MGRATMMVLASLLPITVGCGAGEATLSELSETGSYALFGSPVEREEFAGWYGALVIEDEPTMTGSLVGNPETDEPDGWEARYDARHGYLFFVHLVVTEGRNDGRSFHYIRLNRRRTMLWTTAVIAPAAIALIALVMRARRRKS